MAALRRWLVVGLALAGGCQCGEPARARSLALPQVSALSSASASVSLRQHGVPGAVRGAAPAPAPSSSAPPPPWDRAFSSGIAWLEHAGELGVDALVFAAAAGELVKSEPAAALVAHRRKSLSDSDVGPFGKLLDLAKPPLAAASLDGVKASAGKPDPSMPMPVGDAGESLVERCLRGAVTCTPSPACDAFVQREDRWGYVLSHQGVALVIAHWAGCRPPFDVEAHRRRIAADLVAETRAFPHYGDLFVERLAILGHLGFAESYEPDWIASLRAAQQPSGCWPVVAGQPCSAHATALALLALAHAHRAGML
jgi:hypothetical protein